MFFIMKITSKGVVDKKGRFVDKNIFMWTNFFIFVEYLTKVVDKLRILHKTENYVNNRLFFNVNC